MLLTIGVVLIAFWLIGLLVFHVAGWLIHILLVLAVIMILMRLIRGE